MSERHDYEILRERLEAEGWTFDDDAGGVHCNWFWAQLGGTTPDGRPFYYRLKHGSASFTWTDLCPDLSVSHAEEEVEPDPDPDVVNASLHRLMAEASEEEAWRAWALEAQMRTAAWQGDAP